MDRSSREQEENLRFELQQVCSEGTICPKLIRHFTEFILFHP